MKRMFYGLLMISLTCLFAQEKVIKLNSFEHKKEEGCLFKRDASELGTEFDETGNGLLIDDAGNVYIVQCDMQKLYRVNIPENKLIFLKDLDFLEHGSEGISKITENYYFCTGRLG